MARARQPGQDTQNRTGRTGQPEQDSQNRTARTGQAEQDCLNRRARTDSQDMKANMRGKTGKAVQDGQTE